jgi:hypothetical protein
VIITTAPTAAVTGNCVCVGAEVWLPPALVPVGDRPPVLRFPVVAPKLFPVDVCEFEFEFEFESTLVTVRIGCVEAAEVGEAVSC